MCTNKHLIYNRFIKDSFYVPCGCCPACLQQKAYRRAFRIKNEASANRIALFVTLTYDRSSCPFVLQSDVDARLEELPVYREFSTRRVRCSDSGFLSYDDRRTYGKVELCKVFHPNYDSLLFSDRFRWLSHRRGHIGVCYYPDIQNFKKRLRLNLIRRYGFKDSFKIYTCSEYGETTSRPHFHALVFIDPSFEEVFRNAISEAWPFADKSRTKRYTEVARDVANYLASYVNCGSHLHKFLSDNFKVKHSYSKGFGFSSDIFSLDSVLSKIRERDFSYVKQIGRTGNEQFVSVSIPKYVVNRYFPLFKGYSRFADVEVLDVLRCFIEPENFSPPKSINYALASEIDYSILDLHKISQRLINAYRRVNALHPLSVDDYIYLYRDAWRVFRLTNLRLWYEDDLVPPKYRYDNSFLLKQGSFGASLDYPLFGNLQLRRSSIYSPETLFWLDSSPEPYISDVNLYPDNIEQTSRLSNIYAFRCKERKLNNFVMSQNNYFF